MLKAIFSSNTRVKILTAFLLNPEDEFYIRELTRKLNEQINSVRRELDNLRKIGFLKSRNRNRRKYYHVNKNFLVYSELKSLVTKAVNTENAVVKKIAELGEINLLILSGIFIDRQAQVDIFIVGQIDKNRLAEYLNNEFKENIKYSIISKDDFLYRLECNDKFTKDMLTNRDNIIAVNKLKKITEKYRNL